MARTLEGKLLTEEHRRRQLGLRALTMKDVVKVYPSWRLRDPETYKRLEDLLVTLTQMRHSQSAAIAARYYQEFRAVDAPAGTAASVEMTYRGLEEGRIRAAVSATSRAAVWRALGAGQSYEQAMANGLVEVSGAVARLSLNGGRDTITDAVQTDAKALGWARVTGEAPCAFCAMLASRGPVYKEETVGFDAHDHDACSAEPVYPGSEWPGRGREFQQMWKQTGSLDNLRQEMAHPGTWTK